MALTDQMRSAAKSVKEGAITAASNVLDTDKRTALIESSRELASRGAARVTDTAGSLRDAAREHGPTVVDKARETGTKGVELVRENAPKARAVARRFGRRTSEVANTNAPAATGFIKRHREEVVLLVAVLNVVFQVRRVVKRRRTK